MNNFMLRDLMELHCGKCNGAIFGCNGCDKEERTIEILNLYLEEPKEIGIEVIEEPVEVIKETKNNKKK